MLGPLYSLDEEQIKNLCKTACPESSRLDFKRTLPATNTEEAKKAFLKDICAFTNFEGGDLVFGITDKDGIADTVMPIVSETADAAKRRLGQVIAAGIEPRINVEMKEVVVDGGYVLIARIPASFVGPVQFFDNFVIRSGTHTNTMSYNQIREAFMLANSTSATAQSWRATRIEKLLRGETWNIVKQPMCVLHVIPISSLLGRQQLNIGSLYQGEWMKFFLNGYSEFNSARRETNLDGLICGSTPDHGYSDLYTQIFRNGMTETVYSCSSKNPSKEMVYIHGPTIASFVRDAIRVNLDQLYTLGITGPAIIGLSLLGVEAHSLMTAQHGFNFMPKSDRPSMRFPEVWIDNMDVFDIDIVVKPLLDMLWQAFRLPECDAFTPDGVWKKTQ